MCRTFRAKYNSYSRNDPNKKFLIQTNDVSQYYQTLNVLLNKLRSICLNIYFVEKPEMPFLRAQSVTHDMQKIFLHHNISLQ